MATYTELTRTQASELLQKFGLDVVRIFPIAEGSVNSNYRVETSLRRSVFVRIYEEQDRAGAEAEARLLAYLARAGIETPGPIARTDGEGFTVEHVTNGKSRPLAVFPWQEGEMICQERVNPKLSYRVGEALARIHIAGAGFREERPGRYEIEGLRERLERIAHADCEELRSMAPKIAQGLEELAKCRDASLKRGIIHGDLFRDNVLWRGGKISALLDFESASEGVYAYDLMVTLLAWSYGDCLDEEIARALMAGYQSKRSLDERERAALSTEGKIATLRFTITRMTDFSMRSGQVMVQKDWRRFWARYQRLVELGEGGIERLVG